MGSRAYRGGVGRSQSPAAGDRRPGGGIKTDFESITTIARYGYDRRARKARGWMARRGAIGEGSMGSPKRARPAPAELTAAAATERGLARWLPLAAILGLMALAFAMGWHNYLSFKTIGLNYDLLKAFIEANLPLALAAFMLVYIAVIALAAGRTGHDHRGRTAVRVEDRGAGHGGRRDDRRDDRLRRRQDVVRRGVGGQSGPLARTSAAGLSGERAELPALPEARAGLSLRGGQPRPRPARRACGLRPRHFSASSPARRPSPSPAPDWAAS